MTGLVEACLNHRLLNLVLELYVCMYPLHAHMRGLDEVRGACMGLL